MDFPDRTRWNRLRPELEALLGMAPPEQIDRLSALRTHDPDLAAELAAMLRASLDAAAQHFLEGDADAGSPPGRRRPFDA